MKRIMLGVTILPAMLVCSVLAAQDLDKLGKRAANQEAGAGNVTQTEDMWFYLQELRRYDDPQAVVRRKAERKGDQRRQRLAAMKWYGYSQGRPSANPTPSMGVYSPTWVGNGADPYQWIGNAYVTTVLRVETAAVTTTTKTR